ncbi:MAG TPA: helix-turn-helix transcriptional regulator [Mesorhizobium sp.]|jgi:transcriptional regulator with XRE-family HTH domain|nr:helix-turn-helix transcriptional regulator [Mesorhizobium sp.]
METISTPVGAMIREWRRQRRLSQLDLASEAEISQRHLSFVESGRSKPSRDMILKLSEHLSVPLRERNRLLVAGGFAPGFSERPLHDPSLTAAREAVELVLTGHMPHPAMAVDRHWNLVSANAAIQPFLGAADPSLLQPPVNVLRLSLHPKGLAPLILNLDEWRGHLIERLRRQADASADPTLAALEKELAGYPGGGRPLRRTNPAHAVALPLRLRFGGRALSLISTVTVFGTPLDVTLSEIAIESFFPADGETAAILRAMAAG